MPLPKNVLTFMRSSISNVGSFENWISSTACFCATFAMPRLRARFLMRVTASNRITPGVGSPKRSMSSSMNAGMSSFLRIAAMRW